MITLTRQAETNCKLVKVTCLLTPDANCFQCEGGINSFNGQWQALTSWNGKVRINSSIFHVRKMLKEGQKSGPGLKCSIEHKNALWVSFS